MKNKINIIIIFISLIFCFIIFYIGLDKPNTYTPKTNTEKNLPIFKAKDFTSNNYIDSDKNQKNLYRKKYKPSSNIADIAKKFEKNNSIVFSQRKAKKKT